MDAQTKDRPGWHRQAVSKNPNASPDSTPPITRKWQRILASFLAGHTWHALTAVRQLGTTCLSADVCDLERRGLKFNRTRITVPGFCRTPTSVVSYRLEPESYRLAATLLGLVADDGGRQDDAAAYLMASRGQRGAP